MAIDETTNDFSQFREAVKEAILETYAATVEEVEMVLIQELDTLMDIFQDGSVDEAATVLAVLNNLEDK